MKPWAGKGQRYAKMVEIIEAEMKNDPMSQEAIHCSQKERLQ